jgi:Ca-activated chloride channel homolog
VSRRAAWLIASGVAAAVAVAAAGAQQITFSSRTEAVRVDVLVSDRGVPVRGLGPADFEVWDNGVPQQVELVSFEQLPLRVVLALDMSDSVAGEGLRNLRSASLALLGGLNSGDEAALITFNEAVTLRAASTGEFGRVRAALEGVDPSGSTSTIDAGFAALTIGESGVGRGLVIFFSDGLDTSSWLRQDDVLDIAKRCDAVVYAVSTTRASDDRFLRALTDQTGGRRMSVEKTKDIGAAFLEMLNEFRQRYVVSYTPSGVAREGWHRLIVRVKNRNATVRARPGYLAQF